MWCAGHATQDTTDAARGTVAGGVHTPGTDRSLQSSPGVSALVEPHWPVSNAVESAVSVCHQLRNKATNAEGQGWG